MGSTLHAALATGAVLMFAAGAAVADDGSIEGEPQAPVIAYSLFNPAPTSALHPLVTDRPAKIDGPGTVDPGHLQIEADIFNATFQRLDGVTEDVLLLANATLKAGLTDTTDAEATFAPTETVFTRKGGARRTETGPSDLFLRVKWNFFAAANGSVSVAASPYVKVPTAPEGLGDGAVEGGLIVPVQVALPGDFALGFVIEADDLKDQESLGRHLNTVGIVNLSRPLTKEFSGAVELWLDNDHDPKAPLRQRSLDLGLAFTPAAMPAVQFDGGVNLGLTRETPGAQVYLGVSHRF
jgi:hypothetical protein